jgi:beta-glucosidase
MTSPPALPFRDPTLSPGQRADDLLSRMELEDKVGLLFQPMASLGGLDEPGPFGFPSVSSNLECRITHMNMLLVPSAREIAEWYNAVQREALRHPLGVPVTIASDPRHSFSNNPVVSFMAGPFSQWPEPLGFAAIGSEGLVERFAEVVREEYLAVGIRVALHPQIDLATEPRWARQSTTFGEDASLASRLAVAYVHGLQGAEVGPGSVAAMAKHFPGGGPQKDGEDPHFPYGREQVYPGGMFDLHLKPFEAVIAAGVAQIMPYYGMPVGTDYEEVGFGFNKGILTDLLRGTLGFEGVVVSDWGIVSGTCWGVEDLSYEDRMCKALDAGVDQFGGETSTEVMLALVRSGTVSEERIDSSARRLLREKFRLGLFDDPFVDADRAEVIVGAPPARAEGLAAQTASLTLLQNAAQGPGQLPLAAGLAVYVENMAQDALAGRARMVDTPEEADVAILRLVAPWAERGEPDSVERHFHAGSLAFADAELDRVGAIARNVPTVVDVYLDRPAILAPLATRVSSLIADFGASDEAVARVLFGEAAPHGSLPFDIPSTMEAVEASRPDVPFDTEHPTYRFGYGLRYTDTDGGERRGTFAESG